MLKIPSYLIGTFILLTILMPRSAFAAELLFSASADSRTVEVHIDPQSKSLNVVEGKIRFSGPGADGLTVRIENGQSILPIWPTPPLYDEQDKSISFVGGVPNGFNAKGLLFRLQISQTKPDDLTIAYVDGNAYLNDGKGTKESVSSNPLELRAANDGTATATNDNNKNDNNANNYSQDSGNAFKYATIILLIAIVLYVIFHNAYKKSYKK